MQTATLSVKFSFNSTIYQQTDDVAIGSSLGPALTNILVGYQKTKLFLNVKKPLMYSAMLITLLLHMRAKTNVKNFLLHSILFALYYNSCSKKELNSSFLFFGILIEKHSTGFITSVYRKPTLINQYLHIGILLALHSVKSILYLH